MGPQTGWGGHRRGGQGGGPNLRLSPRPPQRCEEVEAMRGLVSQEQELRAVVESCLLEQDSARKDVRAQLQEARVLAQDAALVLDQLR